jgi:hypothetical protein
MKRKGITKLKTELIVRLVFAPYDKNAVKDRSFSKITDSVLLSFLQLSCFKFYMVVLFISIF